MERKSYINPVNDNDLSNIIPELIYKISQRRKLISKLSSEIEEDKKQIMLCLSNARQIGYTDKEIRDTIGTIIIGTEEVIEWLYEILIAEQNHK